MSEPTITNPGLVKAITEALDGLTITQAAWQDAYGADVGYEESQAARREILLAAVWAVAPRIGAQAVVEAVVSGNLHGGAIDAAKAAERDRVIAVVEDEAAGFEHGNPAIYRALMSLVRKLRSEAQRPHCAECGGRGYCTARHGHTHPSEDG